jgi:hypothetical protein
MRDTVKQCSVGEYLAGRLEQAGVVWYMAESPGAVLG